MNIKILVATHKKYNMPLDNMYMPLHVGKEGKQNLGYQGDNTGDNISDKNQSFCELTGLFWAWKNLKCDYIGLCHYRRYFTVRSAGEKILNKNKKLNLILTNEEVTKLLSEAEVIVPKKRNYYIETIWSHYKHAHKIKDLEETRNIISQIYPEYLESFDKVMNQTKLHLYNMFIMDKNKFDDYCKWLFNIILKLEKNIDISDYDSYQKRVFGFISERLFNVWLEKNKFPTKEVDVINLDKINWPDKIVKFVKRKINK